MKIIEKYSFYVFRKKFELSAFVVTATPRKALVVSHVKVLPIPEQWHDANQNDECASNEDSDQTGHSVRS